jgi:hypothetical protein
MISCVPLQKLQICISHTLKCATKINKFACSRHGSDTRKKEIDIDHGSFILLKHQRMEVLNKRLYIRTLLVMNKSYPCEVRETP